MKICPITLGPLNRREPHIKSAVNSYNVHPLIKPESLRFEVLFIM